MWRILYPFALPYLMIRLWKNATPEQRVALKSKTVSEEEKQAIVNQIITQIHPELVL